MRRSGSLWLCAPLVALGCLADPASYASGGGGNGGVPASGGAPANGAGGAGGGDGGTGLNVEWVLALGTPAEQTLTAFAVGTAGEVLVGGQWVGEFQQTPLSGGCQGQSHAYVQLITPEGSPSWLRCFGGAASVEAIDVNEAGYVAVVGSFENGIIVGNGVENSAGAHDIFVVLLEPDGEIAWGATYGSTGNDQGMGVALADDGTVYVSGSFHGQFSFDGHEVMAKTGADLFLAKLDGGAAQWAHQLDNGGVAPTLRVGVRRGLTGPVVATGTFEGSLDVDGPGPTEPVDAVSESDAFVMGFTSLGVPTFYRPVAGGGRQEAHAIQTSGEIAVVSGNFVGTVDFDEEGPLDPVEVATVSAFALTFDFSGSLLALHTVGGTGTTRGRAVGLDRAGAAGKCVGGNFDGELALSGASGTAREDAVDAFFQCFKGEQLSVSGIIGPSGGAQSIDGIARVGSSIVIAGRFAAELELGAGFPAKGADDVFVAKLSPTR